MNESDDPGANYVAFNPNSMWHLNMKSMVSMIKQQLVLLSLLLALHAASVGQRHITRNGTIRFFSEAPLENIEAVNKQVSSALDLETGEFVFRVLMRAFQFEKALMQEHFNDNFVESHNHPNANFVGRVVNLHEIDIGSRTPQEVTVEGRLTIKGVTREISETGSLTWKEGVIMGESVFSILLADYDIRIPAAVSRNISPEIEISVDLELHELDL